MDANVVLRPRQSRVAPPYSTPSPTKGMNTVLNIAAMPVGYARQLQNVICEPDGIALRTGYREWSTGMPSDVTSLIPYVSGSSAPSKLFAISGSAMYDVTNGGAVGAPVVSGLDSTFPYWE